MEVKEDIIAALKEGFADTPYPGSRFPDISVTKHDEGIYDYFVGSDPFDHDVADLRYHSAALSFFTVKAFRYWLPAFMIAELEDPVEADIIAESLAFHLSEARGARERIDLFSPGEKSAIRRFFNECIRRYPDKISARCFRKALIKMDKADG